jgi:hypothetical protein
MLLLQEFQQRPALTRSSGLPSQGRPSATASQLSAAASAGAAAQQAAGGEGRAGRHARLGLRLLLPWRRGRRNRVESSASIEELRSTRGSMRGSMLGHGSMPVELPSPRDSHASSINSVGVHVLEALQSVGSGLQQTSITGG